MNIFHDGQRPVKPSEYILTSPDLVLDIYSQAQNRGYTQPHQMIHLRKLLIDGFRKLLAQHERLDPAADQIFSKVGNPPCFNYRTQFLRLSLIKLLMYCLPPQARQEIDQPGIHFMDRVEYIPAYQKILTYLIQLEAWDTIIWFFWQVPIWSNFPAGGLAGYRQVYLATLDLAIETWPDAGCYRIPASFEMASKGSTYYYNLAYHGLSNRELITKFNRLLRRVYPVLNYTAKGNLIDPTMGTGGAAAASSRFMIPYDEKLEYLLDIFDKENKPDQNKPGELVTHLSKLSTPGNTNKIRICFVSNKLTTYSSVFRDRIGVINGLDPRYFDVYVAVFKPLDKIFNPMHKIVSRFLDNLRQKDRIIVLKTLALRDNQKSLADRQFHIIFYPDLGMQQDYTLLAHARLAPVQITTWGHSDTSGNPSIDYFITSRYFENTTDLDIPRSNYSETPILLNSTGTYYFAPRAMIRNVIDPGFEAGFMTATRLGFPPGAIIIGVLQSFFKFTNEFEQVLAKILQMTANRPRPVVIAMSNSIPFNKLHLERLQTHFKNYTDRIFWFQNKSAEEWLNLVSLCHIMLDPFPFGGCNTSLEAFDYGVPVVCRPSNQINGRFTSGFYDVMGIGREYCCAANTEEFIKLAHRLIDDDYYYRMVREKIRANSSKLFENTDSIREYQTVLTTLVRRHLSKDRVLGNSTTAQQTLAVGTHLRRQIHRRVVPN